MKKSVKLILAVLTILMIGTLFVTSVNASLDPSSITATDPGGSVSTKTQTIAGKIFGGIRIIGSGVAVVMLAVLGIKYMIGSAEEKAEYKKSMMPLLIGAVLLFAASNLASIIYNFANGLK